MTELAQPALQGCSSAFLLVLLVQALSAVAALSCTAHANVDGVMQVSLLPGTSLLAMEWCDESKPEYSLQCSTSPTKVRLFACQGPAQPAASPREPEGVGLFGPAGRC